MLFGRTCYITRIRFGCFNLRILKNSDVSLKAIKIILKTRGPIGPWVAHLKKMSKVTVEPFTEDH